MSALTGHDPPALMAPAPAGEDALMGADLRPVLMATLPPERRDPGDLTLATTGVLTATRLSAPTTPLLSMVSIVTTVSIPTVSILGNKSVPVCPDSQPPMTCLDGSNATRVGHGHHGGHHGGVCDDGSRPTCSDGAAPVYDGDMSTPPCTDNQRPSTCADGSTPTRRPRPRPSGGRFPFGGRRPFGK